MKKIVALDERLFFQHWQMQPNEKVPDFILVEDVVLFFVSREIVETFIFPLTLTDWLN